MTTAPVTVRNPFHVAITPPPAMQPEAADTERDYDAAYLEDRAYNNSDEDDLPLFTPPPKPPVIVTSAELIARCSQYLSSVDVELIQEAFRYADEAHLGQFRKSGEPYITHPLAVASILASWHLDAATVCAGLMHDVLEDTHVAKVEMAEKFGIEITEIVDGVSKLDKLRFATHALLEAESFRKMLLAMSRDVRVILVKLADRLHNMRTLGVMRPEKQRRIATETLDIYVPIAHQLGINTVFRELQELAFMYQHPLRYQILKDNVVLARGNRKAVLEKILKATREALPKSHIRAKVQGREKTIYGIYNKMRESHYSFSDVLDVYGFRVIVNTREECYLALCALHQLYKPVQGRFRDFIAIPKSNGYRSLHTTVIGPYGTPVEYQIRTERMNHIDEAGILSHWLYNDGLDTSEVQNLTQAWLQSLLEIQRTTSDSAEFIENIKSDLFPDRVYVFTPKSKIISLPKGACPVDFAYQIHTDVGNKAVHCRINGEEQPLGTILHNGDMVEIITGRNAVPDPQWLTFAKSGKARAEIRQYLRNRSFEQSVELGEKIFNQAAADASLNLDTVPDDVWQKIIDDCETKNRTAFFASMGLGKIFPAAVVARIQNIMRSRQPHQSQASSPVEIQGTEGVSVQLATCCHPIPGDAIWGFMRKGHGLTVHRADCEHVHRGRQADPQRWMQLSWKDEFGDAALYPVPIEMQVTDDRAALAAISVELARLGSAIVGVNLGEKGNEEDHHYLRIMVQVKNRIHLLHILRCLRGISSIRSIARRLDNGKLIHASMSD